MDKIYMTFVQATTGQGGWPLNVFLTPDLKPFFGGTYFPPDNRYGRPGFLHSPAADPASSGQTRHGDLIATPPRTCTRASQQCTASDAGPPAAPLDRRQSCATPAQLLKESVRPAPRRLRRRAEIPAAQPAAVPAALRASASRTTKPSAWCCTPATAWPPAASTTSSAAASPATPSTPNGSCRTSRRCSTTTRSWRSLYLDAFLVSGDARYAAVARDILDYVLRDMTHPDGGFYSAEDADSEGQEGKFYCWTTAELSRAAHARRNSTWPSRYFGITDAGQLRRPQRSRIRCPARTC